MPIQEIDFSSYLTQPPVSGQVIKAIGYPGAPIYAKHDSTKYVLYLIKPSGAVLEVDVSSVLPSPPVNGVALQVADLQDDSGHDVPFYWSTKASKWKCGTPI